LLLFTLEVVFFYEEKFYNTLVCYFESNDLYLELKDYDGCISALSMIVNYYLHVNDRNRAFEYVQKMRLLLPKCLNNISYGKYNYNLAQYCYATGKMKEAEKASYLAIYYFEKAGASIEVIRALKILGDIKLGKKELYKSVYSYQLAINKSAAINDSSEIAILYTRISHVYGLLDDYREVLKYNKKALRLREKHGTEELIVSSLINIGGTYLKLEKYDSAKYYLEKGIAMGRPLNKSFLLEHAYKELFIFYMKIGDMKEAINNYKNYAGFHRKLIADQNDNEIKKLETSRLIREAETRMDLLKKENEVQSLQYHNRKIQNIMLEVLLLFALSVVLFIYLQRKKNVASRLKFLVLNNQLKLDIEERIHAEVKLRESEKLYRFLAEHSGDVISHLDCNFNRKYISPSSKNLFGYGPEELLDQKPVDLIDPLDIESVRTSFASMIRSKEPGQFIYKIIPKDGKKLWVEANINPFFDPKTGQVKEFLAMLRNITEQKFHEETIAENERQKEILLKEIHNRVKNNFAILISLMDLQKEIGHENALNRSMTELQLRVRTMSLVHEQLYITDNIRKVQLDQYLMTLVKIIVNAYEKSRITLHLEINECLIDIGLALPLGLIVNELLTNAFKYAFPGKMSGNIRVTLHPFIRDEEQKNSEKTLWKLTVSDDGIGLPEFYTMDPKSGMGSQIIRILVDQIEANLDIVSQQGANFTLTFSNIFKPVTNPT